MTNDTITAADMYRDLAAAAADGLPQPTSVRIEPYRGGQNIVIQTHTGDQAHQWMSWWQDALVDGWQDLPDSAPTTAGVHLRRRAQRGGWTLTIGWFEQETPERKRLRLRAELAQLDAQVAANGAA